MICRFERSEFISHLFYVWVSIYMDENKLIYDFDLSSKFTEKEKEQLSQTIVYIPTINGWSFASNGVYDVVTTVISIDVNSMSILLKRRHTNDCSILS